MVWALFSGCFGASSTGLGGSGFGSSTLMAALAGLLDKYRAECAERKRLFNLVQELRGNIRVFCRMRKPNKFEDSLKYDSTMIDDGENCYSFDYILILIEYLIII